MTCRLENLVFQKSQTYYPILCYKLGNICAVVAGDGNMRYRQVTGCSESKQIWFCGVSWGGLLVLLQVCVKPNYKSMLNTTVYT